MAQTEPPRQEKGRDFRLQTSDLHPFLLFSFIFLPQLCSLGLSVILLVTHSLTQSFPKVSSEEVVVVRPFYILSLFPFFSCVS